MLEGQGGHEDTRHLVSGPHCQLPGGRGEGAAQTAGMKADLSHEHGCQGLAGEAKDKEGSSVCPK